MYRISALLFLVCVSASSALTADTQVELSGRTFQVADGYQLELVVQPPLAMRPICADFDERGDLFVADSSGSNDNVETQLREKPHRVLRLRDVDGDGRFDASTVFADQMMFPEGVLCYRGSVYVTAPPQIWKLTDVNGDGIADQREVWFDGQTLTGCANDLHGPFIGPDGWIYWCKGAFAEQTYERVDGSPWQTRAAHIFRRRPEGGPVEPVMTGGMDNPVEVAFTRSGERIFTTTFLQHPGGGKRDGLIHAIYGGVYGKIHSVIDDHPRTGDIMPVLEHLGAAAPSGLCRLESPVNSGDDEDCLLACQFNMHKVSLHRLTASGATFTCNSSDFVSTEDLDFHPTDVVEDADGSVLVVDTGGWYKLCCPTSQLHKPDVLGAIYRVRRVGQAVPEDPWGQQIRWQRLGTDRLVSLLRDARPKVRWRAVERLGQAATTDASVIMSLADTLADSSDALQRRMALWTLCRIDGEAAREATRIGLNDDDATVRQVATQAVSVWCDAAAFPSLITGLVDRSPAEQRVAAEALGRIGAAQAADQLFSLLEQTTVDDRVLQHSLTFALIELNDSEAVAARLSHENRYVRRAALLALDQMADRRIVAQQVVERLEDPATEVQQTARWLLQRHAEWAPEASDYVSRRLRVEGTTDESLDELNAMVSAFLTQAAFRSQYAAMLLGTGLGDAQRLWLLAVLKSAPLSELPGELHEPMVTILRQTRRDPRLLEAVADVLLAKNPGDECEPIVAALGELAVDHTVPSMARLKLAAAAPVGRLRPDESLFGLLLEQLSNEDSVEGRSLAVRAIANSRLDSTQLERLTETLPDAGPLELPMLLDAFRQTNAREIGEALAVALGESPALGSIPPVLLQQKVEHFDETVRRQMQQMLVAQNLDDSQRQAKLQDLLDHLGPGDVRRGQQVFMGAKAACSACHAMGYLGGNIGPDLTNIGKIRSRRDLLEAIVFPSASFVRSYEPISVVTLDGLAYHGVVRDDRPDAIVIATTDRREIQVARDEIDEIAPSLISVMPSGLDGLLTQQEVADLLAFLQGAQ